MARRTGYLLVSFVIIFALLQVEMGRRIDAQGLPTATPAQIDLSGAQQAAQDAVATVTPTRTPTPVGPVQIQARELANVRAAPDPGAELLGQIRPGEYYNVLRRYFRWIEFQYDAAPSRRGWVFDELVDIIGEPNSIPVVESLEEVNSPSDFDVTSTDLAISATPGALLTATAQARTNPDAMPGALTLLPGAVEVAPSTAEVESVVLPTYTYPPNVVPIAPTQDAEADLPVTDDTPARIVSRPNTTVPPLVPIAVLSAVGLLGLLVSSIRR